MERVSKEQQEVLRRQHTLHKISETEYRTELGHTMRREEGLTPNGNPINERWVLREPDGTWIDVDRYRSDLAEHHGFTIKGE